MSIVIPWPWLGSYAEGVPHDIEPQEGSLYDLVRGSVVQYGDHVALEFFRRTTNYKVAKRVVQADELSRSLIGKVLRRQVRNSLVTG